MARGAVTGAGGRFLRWRMASRKQIDRFLECAPVDMANERDHIAADVAFAAIKHLLFDVNPEPIRPAANRARPGAIGATALQSDPASRDLVLDADRAGIGGQVLGGQRAPSFKRDSPVSRGISRFPATLTVRSFPCDMSL
jgi:hypothetical protein